MKSFTATLYLIIMFSIIITACNNQENTNNPSVGQNYDSDINNFLKTRQEKGWHRPECDERTIRDLNDAITKFQDRFLESGDKLPYLKGFSIRLAEFEKMFKELKIDKKPGKDTLFAIRFYPAIDSKDSLYIVFIGEIVDMIKPLPQRYWSMRNEDHYYCVLKSNYQTFQVVREVDAKSQIESEIKRYQTKYRDIIEPPSYVAYVDSARRMLTELFPTGDDIANRTFYAINMQPALFSKNLPYKILIITKPQKITVDEAGAESRQVISDKCYYDEMNECPQYCPTNKIQ